MFFWYSLSLLNRKTIYLLPSEKRHAPDCPPLPLFHSQMKSNRSTPWPSCHLSSPTKSQRAHGNNLLFHSLPSPVCSYKTAQTVSVTLPANNHKALPRQQTPYQALWIKCSAQPSPGTQAHPKVLSDK